MQARSYVQARGDSFLLVPRRLNFFETQILRKVIKIVATRCQILTLKYIKIDFGWGSAPDPAGGAYSRRPALMVLTFPAAYHNCNVIFFS